MVSTRHHPRAYPPPEVAVEEATSATTASNSASKSSSGGGGGSKTTTTTTTTTATSTTSGGSSNTPASKPRARAKSKPRVSTAKASTSGTASSPGPDSPTTTTTMTTTTTRSRAAKRGIWQHTPSRLILYWLCVSLPLVIWDTGYVLGRPHTMPGGWAHAPIWSPYELYGRVDYIYGWPAVEKRNGFTSAQGSLNVIETLLYLAYLYVVRRNGREPDGKAAGARGRRKSTSAAAAVVVEGRGAPSRKLVGWLAEARVLSGAPAGAAVLIAFSASVMTLSKTILYWLNEYFSGFDNIGHNSWLDLVFLWIIPNGAWIVLPAWMSYVFGAEILEGLSIASGAPAPKPIATVKDE